MSVGSGLALEESLGALRALRSAREHASQEPAEPPPLRPVRKARPRPAAPALCISCILATNAMCLEMIGPHVMSLTGRLFSACAQSHAQMGVSNRAVDPLARLRANERNTEEKVRRGGNFLSLSCNPPGNPPYIKRV